MSSTLRFSLGALVALAVGLWCAAGMAQPSVETTVSTDRAEVGERFQVRLEAMSSEEPAPSSPRLEAPPGFVVEGPSVSSRHQVSIINGDFTHQRGLTATWSVVGTKPGKYTLGPVRVQLGGRTVSGKTYSIEIVPKGSLKRSPSARPRPNRRKKPFGDPFDFDPFDLMPKMPGFPRDDDPLDSLRGRSSEHPPELEVDRARDPIAFLKAVTTPTEAVVGEQITLKIFAYGSRGPFKEVYTSEPSRADFVSHAIIENSYNEPRYRMYIDNELWHAVQVREIALFPLKAGTLEIGRMRMGFSGTRYPQDAPHKGLVRYSEPLTVTVREPPVAGRPSGYQIGDVGRFTLSAQVDPREINAGDAVSVRVELKGTGNPPSRLQLPEKKGVRFNDPNIDESIEAQGSTIRGSRIFSYIVHVSEPGTVDLGEITLPYYDPRRQRYATARADLGTIQVHPSRTAGPAAKKDEPEVQRIGEHAEVRTELGPPVSGSGHWTDHPAYWALLAGGPAFVVTAAGAARARRRLAERWANRRQSHSVQARQALREAREAASRGEMRAATAAIERAVYASLEERTGLRARGILRSELGAELERCGLPSELATDVVALLDSLDDLRFASGGAGSLDAVVARADEIVTRLSRVKRRSPAR